MLKVFSFRTPSPRFPARPPLPDSKIPEFSANAVAAIKAGRQKILYLGNLNPKRDWGHAEDYVRAMWMMLQAKTPKDYVVASGKCHSVREFCQIAFARAGLDWKKYVRVSKKFFRPAEVMRLEGDSRKIRRDLGWKPQVSFKTLVERMVDHDLLGLFGRS